MKKLLYSILILGGAAFTLSSCASKAPAAPKAHCASCGQH